MNKVEYKYYNNTRLSLIGQMTISYIDDMHNCNISTSSRNLHSNQCTCLLELEVSCKLLLYLVRLKKTERKNNNKHKSKPGKNL